MPVSTIGPSPSLDANRLDEERAVEYAARASQALALQDTLTEVASATEDLTRVPGPSTPKLPQVILANLCESEIAFRNTQIEKTAASIQESANRSQIHHQAVMEKKLEEMEVEYNPSWYDWLLDGATVLAASASIVVGGALVSTGLPPAMYIGAGAIAAGVGTIGSLVWHQIGGDPLLSRGVNLTMSGISLMLLSSSYFFYAHMLPGLITTIVMSTYAVTSACAEASKGYLEKIRQDIAVAIEEFSQRLKMGELFRTEELEVLQMHAQASLDVSKALIEASQTITQANLVRA